MWGRYAAACAVALVAATAAGCGSSGAKSSSNASLTTQGSTTTTTTTVTGGSSGASSGGSGGGTASKVNLHLILDGTYNGKPVQGTVVPGSLQCVPISTGGKQGLQVTWGGTVNGTGQVSGDMMFAGGWHSITFGDGKSQGEASLVVKGDYQNRYGASSALGQGTEGANPSYSGGSISAELDGGSAGKMHVQGTWGPC